MVTIANKWTLTNVKLLDVQQSSGSPSEETWTMSFDQFELVHYENGVPQTPGFCWNLGTNMAC